MVVCVCVTYCCFTSEATKLIVKNVIVHYAHTRMLCVCAQAVCHSLAPAVLSNFLSFYQSVIERQHFVAKNRIREF